MITPCQPSPFLQSTKVADGLSFEGAITRPFASMSMTDVRCFSYRRARRRRRGWRWPQRPGPVMPRSPQWRCRCLPARLRPPHSREAILLQGRCIRLVRQSFAEAPSARCTHASAMLANARFMGAWVVLSLPEIEVPLESEGFGIALAMFWLAGSRHLMSASWQMKFRAFRV
jgi:hypothetical protein